MTRIGLIVVCLTAVASIAAADYATVVELENLSGQDKTDWPVIVNVWQVLGRNIPAGTLHPKGYRVVGPGGKDLAWDIEEIPPADVLSNDELVFVVPSIKAGQTISVTISNTPKDAGTRKDIDVVASPHNLIANAGFEKGGAKSVECYTGQAVLDTAVKRRGKSAMLIAGDAGRRAEYAAKIPLNPGSMYYAGVWCKTENVARHGLAAGNGATFEFAPVEGTGSPFHMLSGYEGVRMATQCGTRDWHKARWWSRYAMDYDDWGVHRNAVAAAAKGATMRLVLDQKKQFVMPEGNATGKWWLDDMVLIEQPKVTPRFDKSVDPLMKDGVFLFTRPVSSALGLWTAKPSSKTPNFAAFPFPHEAFQTLDSFALRGQRVPLLLGVYHNGPLKGVKVSVAGGGLGTAPRGSGGSSSPNPRLPAGAVLPVESIEYSEGFHGSIKTPLLQDASAPVDFSARGVRYFVASFHVPADAAPGRYEGSLDVTVGGKTIRQVPIVLRVQPMVLPEIDDVYVGYIFQGTRLLTEEGLALYARSGFTSLTVFGGFLSFKPLEGGQQQVDIDALDKKMKWLAANGIKAVCLYSEVELDPQWGPGRLFQKSGGTKETYQREIKRMEAAAKAHPDWPRIIYMIWDEPAGHGGIQDKLAWVNEAVPDAWTTLDVDFANLSKAVQYVNTPCIDNPADCTGPELYKWIGDQGKRFGYCGKALNGECTRYQMGIWMIASGAVLQQPWHLEVSVMGTVNKKPARSLGLIACGRGVDDLKVHRLLTDAIKNGKSPAAAAEAKKYLDSVFSVWTGDTAHVSMLMPYLGWASTWGYERFYDDWQEQMARHAAAIKGVKWAE